MEDKTHIRDFIGSLIMKLKSKKLEKITIKDSKGQVFKLDYVYKCGEHVFERYARLYYSANIAKDMDFSKLLTDCMDKMCKELLTF